VVNADNLFLSIQLYHAKSRRFSRSRNSIRLGETFAALREISLATASANQKPILSLFGTIMGDY